MIKIILILGGILVFLVVMFFMIKRRNIAKQAELITENAVVDINEPYPPKETDVTETPPQIEQENTINSAPVTKKEVLISETHEEESLKINKNLPQDSMLRRHYLTHLTMMIEVIYAPYPTDSALKRHYDTMIAAKIEDCLNDNAKMAQLIFDYEIIKITPANVAISTKYQQQEASSENKVTLPESTQRRHYLANVRSIIESHHLPRPTDSTLKRHYDTMIEMEIEQYLAKVAA